jgi:hypothetical protein
MTTTNPKPLEPTYIISSMGPYQRDEKIILKVIIRGSDNRGHVTMAIVDCRATENFIDKEYAEWNGIPLKEKRVPQRVLAVDGREVASGPVTHDAMVELTINNHHETIRIHCITIGNSPIIIRLPWLKRHNPNIDWREGWVTFDLVRCTREYLDTSPHAMTVAEEQAIGKYYRDTTPDATLGDTAYGSSMINEGEEERRTRDETEKDAMEQDAEETIQGWEEDDTNGEPMEEATVPNNPSRIQSPGTNWTSAITSETPRRFNLQVVPDQPPGIVEVAAAEPGILRRFNLPGVADQLSLPPAAGDIVPEEYHNYLHVFEGKENPGLPPHRHHDHRIPLLEGKVPPFELLRALDEGRLHALREYLETSLEWGWIRSSTYPAGAPIHFVKKKNGSLRLCVDYWGLNAITIKD